jgi:hypothetical protein
MSEQNSPEIPPEFDSTNAQESKPTQSANVPTADSSQSSVPHEGNTSTDTKVAPNSPDERETSSGAVVGSNVNQNAGNTGQPDDVKAVHDPFDQHYDGEPKTVDQDFVYPTHQDPMRKLPGTSRYLDDVERENAEIARAKAEDREPDLENPPAIQGTPLVASHVYQGSVPGDVDVQVDKTLPVVVGRPQD